MAQQRYKLGDEIGKGGMGSVYMALDRLSGETVALKQVTTPQTQVTVDQTQSSNRLALTREFQTLASLRHPNIISVLDYGFGTNQQPFFTMEYLADAQPLDGTHLDTPQKLHLLGQMLQALIYLHRRGILHLDLKPANALIQGDTVRLLDFGLALDIEAARSGDHNVSGTLAYMAPEILTGQPPTPAADLYALGIMAYELFAGSLPYDATNSTKLIQQVIQGQIDLKQLDEYPEIAMFIAHLLRFDPAERYPSAQHTLDELQKLTDTPITQLTEEVQESFLQAARFVGREQEVAILVAAIEAAVDGKGQTWLVGGESGVGKTRLLEEVRAQALIRGAVVARGQAVSDGSSRYTLWGSVLRQLILTVDLEDDAASVLKVIVPDIGRLLDREIADAPEVDPQTAQARLIEVVLALLAAQPQPVVILLEDLHWANSSLELLHPINAQIATLPVTVIASYRDDERPNLPAELPAMQTLKLDRLRRDAIVELSRSMLGTAAEQTSFLDWLEAETEGNVFFVVEVVRALAEESGDLSRITEMKALPTNLISANMTTILKRRLDRVPESAQALLNLAAVKGRLLNPDLLAHLSPETDLQNWLLICGDAAILEVRDNQWQFAHDKLREQILSDLDATAIRQQNEQVALSIEALYGESPRYLTDLAFHWGQAANPQKEQHYANLAGEDALRNNANREAARYFQRAMTALMQLPQDEARDRLELALQMNRGVVLTALEGYTAPEVTATYRRGFELAEKLEETAQFFPIMWGFFVGFFGRALYEQAVLRAEKTLALAEQAGDPESLIGAHWAMGIVTACLGRLDDAAHHIAQVDAHYVPETHQGMALTYGQNPLAASLAWLSLVEWLQDKPDAALATVERAVATAEAAEHPFSLAFALMFEGLVNMYLENVDALQATSERLTALCNENGFPYFLIFVGQFSAWLANRDGDTATAIAKYQEGIGTLRAIPAPVLVTGMYAGLAETYLGTKDTEAGLATVDEALAFIEEHAEHTHTAELYRLRAELMHLRGDVAGAQTALEVGLRKAMDQGAQTWVHRCEATLKKLG